MRKSEGKDFKVFVKNGKGDIVSKKNDALVHNCAVIDIGSNELRLRIAEGTKNKVKIIESLTYPLSLGSDTFDTGKISFEKIDKTCNIIKGFMTVCKEYGVTNIKSVATTAVREAENKDYILDQIKIKTSLDLEVVDETEEKILIYKLMTHLLPKDIMDSGLMVYSGAGDIGVSTLCGGKIPFTKNIKIGSLRVSEMFAEIQEHSKEFYKVVEEYLISVMWGMEESLSEEINNFIISGNEISIIAKLCKAHKDGIFLHISTDEVENLYTDIKSKSVDRISVDYNLSLEKAEVMLPAVCIIKILSSYTKCKKIIAPSVFLGDALVYKTLFPDDFSKIDKEFNKSSLLSSRRLCDKYCYTQSHGEAVESFAMKIFDTMKKIHGLGTRDKLLLQIAALMHDCGKYVGMKDHYITSYNMINKFDIVAVNGREKEIIALISMYHSRITPSMNDEAYRRLGLNDRVLVSKLSAILRLADSLDRSNKQKFGSIETKILDNQLIVMIETDKNIDLEHWSFKDKGKFFEEVFGMKAILKKKRDFKSL